ncbi:uncharacterized protein EV420DRAFT_1649890 [Desarmillaria tabescens]|uniref:Uncharacterized protein n=1 Tax=Armillaria tabescens TaxID=1929756 RepID=A0AA39MPF2_ARMTA|nr:uncharacterized protein EV420DRAFT_1649890 [Desarmillaria tabescens]KAK0441782.1 hypothetical protein EV420DRAFT_1649890 [Desarmillaria tabescens]
MCGINLPFPEHVHHSRSPGAVLPSTLHPRIKGVVLLSGLYTSEDMPADTKNSVRLYYGEDDEAEQRALLELASAIPTLRVLLGIGERDISCLCPIVERFGEAVSARVASYDAACGGEWGDRVNADAKEPFSLFPTSSTAPKDVRSQTRSDTPILVFSLMAAASALSICIIDHNLGSFFVARGFIADYLLVDSQPMGITFPSLTLLRHPMNVPTILPQHPNALLLIR